MRDLMGRVAVITGGASGIGLGVARALVKRRVHVVVADIEEEAAKHVAEVFARDGVESLGVGCDVTSRASIEALADRAWERFGRVDIVVNNAGVFPPRAKLIDISEDDARWVLEVNVLGVLHGCAVFGRRLIEQGTPAHIVNTGSENSLGVPHTHAAMYTASKHAVLGLSDVLRRELPDFVGVSIVCPGIVPTQLQSAARNRPQRFGGPLNASGAPTALSGVGMAPDEVGERVVHGIELGDFYIVTHPPVRELVDERAAEIIAAFDAQAPRFEGDERLDTRAVIRSMSSR